MEHELLDCETGSQFENISILIDYGELNHANRDYPISSPETSHPVGQQFHLNAFVYSSLIVLPMQLIQYMYMAACLPDDISDDWKRTSCFQLNK